MIRKLRKKQKMLLEHRTAYAISNSSHIEPTINGVFRIVFGEGSWRKLPYYEVNLQRENFFTFWADLCLLYSKSNKYDVKMASKAPKTFEDFKKSVNIFEVNSRNENQIMLAFLLRMYTFLKKKMQNFLPWGGHDTLTVNTLVPTISEPLNVRGPTPCRRWHVG